MREVGGQQATQAVSMQLITLLALVFLAIHSSQAQDPSSQVTILYTEEKHVNSLCWHELHCFSKSVKPCNLKVQIYRAGR